VTPERWSEIKERLAFALELEATRRPAYLAEVGLADPDLRREIESLLASQEEAGTDFLNAPMVPASVLESPDDHNPLIGRRLGSYQIVEQIGAGGMGEVYRAFRADDEYRKEVAIKLVRAGRDSSFVVSRFKNERQILATLDHPNIARLLDGGTTEEGVPYFVMELIRGQPIDEYSDSHRLATADRLRLFSQVCSAVQYAHQRLIIHRDIKPGNILVTPEGLPKLLDFGIAKILNEGGPADGVTTTQTVLRVMTPGYASPEQVKGEPITTASDVYSLGVVLYELLTGHSPYRLTTRALHEVARAVCEDEPEKPSTAIRYDEGGGAASGSPRITAVGVSAVRDGSPERLRKRLKGDLDNIVLMALRKEPRRRYASVDQLAEDLRRHLANHPVIARQDTAAYRLSKFVARHKAGVAAAAIVGATLLVGMVVTLRAAQIARQQMQTALAERARADRRFKEVRELANSLMFEVHDGIKDLPGSTPVRELLVSRALRYLDSLSQEAGGDPSLMRELAAAYDRVGDLQGSSMSANRGNSTGALRSYRKALAIRESLAAAQSKDPRVQGELAADYVRVADSLESTGDFVAALNALRQAVAIGETLAGKTDDPKIRDGLAGTYYFVGSLLNETGDSKGALENYQRAAAIRKAIAPGDRRHAILVRTHLAGDYGGMATAMLLTGDIRGALQVEGEALRIVDEMSRADPTNATLREYLGEAHNFLGTLLARHGDQARALESHRRAHAIFKELLSADPTNILAKTNFGFSDESIGEILVARGDTVSGLQAIREGLTAFEAMAAGGADNRYIRSGLAQCYFGLGMANAALAANARLSSAEKIKLWREARSWAQKSLNIWVEKRNHGAMESVEREMPKRVAREIAECDTALARLGAVVARQ
jgi:serine/threonine protein kinase/tetratricopeptide (TPR) repeat protein